MEILTADNIRAWKMLPDGNYRKEWSVHTEPVDTQMALASYFAQTIEPLNPRETLSGKMKGFLAALRFGRK